MDLHEGQAGESNGTIVYPDINSCLTITVICAGGLAGGHAVLFAEKGQKSIDEIVAYLQEHARTPQRLYLIGDTGTWAQNIQSLSALKSLDEIAQKLGIKADKSSTIDIEEWTRGGRDMVRITFDLSNRSAKVTANDGKDKPHWETIF